MGPLQIRLAGRCFGRVGSESERALAAYAYGYNQRVLCSATATALPY